MQFNFAEVFSDSYNRGKDRAISNAELQLRAKQVEDNMLTNTVQREQMKAQIALERLRYDLDKSRTESLNEYQSALGDEAIARRDALIPDIVIEENSPIGRMNSSLAGAKVNANEYANLMRVANDAFRASSEQEVMGDLNEALEAIRSTQDLELQESLSDGYQPVNAKEFWESNPVAQQKFGTYENFLSQAEKRGATRDNPEYSALKAKIDAQEVTWGDLFNPFAKAKRRGNRNLLSTLSKNPVIYPTALLNDSDLTRAQNMHTMNKVLANPRIREAFTGNTLQMILGNQFENSITGGSYFQNFSTGSGMNALDLLNTGAQPPQNE